MRFLWKSQLKKERGKFLPETGAEKKKVTRKERLTPRTIRWAVFGMFFLWMFFLGTAGYLVVFSPHLQLISWQVDGLERISEKDFRQTVDQELSRKYFDVIPRNTFFFLQPKALEQALHTQYPLLREVVVQRHFPDQLDISVKERETLVIWCSFERCVQILEDGRVVAVTDALERAENQSHVLRLYDESDQEVPLDENVFDESFVAVILALREGLRNRFGIEIEKNIRMASRYANELRMKTDDGWELYFSTRMAPEKSLNTLGLLLGSEIPKEKESFLQYIDLRTENRVYYRYQDGTVVTEVSSEEITKTKKTDSQEKSVPSGKKKKE